MGDDQYIDTTKVATASIFTVSNVSHVKEYIKVSNISHVKKYIKEEYTDSICTNLYVD